MKTYESFIEKIKRLSHQCQAQETITLGEIQVILALPLPIPLTNTLPAYTIAAICLGSLKEDGLFVGIGWLLFSASILYILLVTHYLKEFF